MQTLQNVSRRTPPLPPPIPPTAPPHPAQGSSHESEIFIHLTADVS